MRVDFQVYKDANDHLSLCDQCDQASLLATHVATQDVQPEDAAHEFRPQVAMGREGADQSRFSDAGPPVIQPRLALPTQDQCAAIIGAQYAQ